MTSFDTEGVARTGWVGRSLRWPLDRLPKEMTMPILSGPVRARRWIIGAGNHDLWLGTYERQKQRAIKAHLEPGMVACDIGAGAGFYSLLMAGAVGAEGFVYAFEPQPDNLNFLRRHLRLNCIRNVLASNEAIANFVGEANFATRAGSDPAHLKKPGQVGVPVVTLDHLFASGRLLPADLVKIDVPGAEAEVLKGAEKFLKRFRPVVFLPVPGGKVRLHCCQYLRDLGYRLRALNGDLDVSQTGDIVASTR